MYTEFIENLNESHLKNWFIRAVNEERCFCETVWKSNRLIPFVGENCPATDVTPLYVRINSIADYKRLIKKLEELDIHHEGRIIDKILSSCAFW